MLAAEVTGSPVTEAGRNQDSGLHQVNAGRSCLSEPMP